MAEHTPDISSEEGILEYFRKTPFDVKAATKLVGGYANFVFRLHLQQPYKGRHTLVLKHGKTFVSDTPSFEFEFPLDRQEFEVNALRRVKEYLPEDALATVPLVHLFDKEAAVIVMDDCGEKSKTFKQLVLDGLSLENAKTIGAALGTFLGRLHEWKKTNPEVVSLFTGHEAGRRLFAFITYGRLVSVLSGPNVPPKLSDPLLDVPQETLEKLGEISVDVTKEMMTTEEVIVQGDFWPGNILVATEEGPGGDTKVKRIYVVDWEVVKPGIAGLDIGQFCAEMHLLRKFHARCEENATAVISSFLGAYRVERREDLKGTAKAAHVHVGAHLVAWPPVIEWGTKEKTREVVEEGIQYLVLGWDDAGTVVKRSMMGDLFSV